MLPCYFAPGGEDVFLRGGRLAAAKIEEKLECFLIISFGILSYALREDARTASLGFSAMFLWRSQFIRISWIGWI